MCSDVSKTIQGTKRWPQPWAGRCGGCSYLERLRELLTDQNMRHSFGGKEKKVNGNRNPSNSSVPAVTSTSLVYFELLCLLHALPTLACLYPPQPCGQGSGLLSSLHMTTELKKDLVNSHRGIQSSARMSCLWAVSTACVSVAVVHMVVVDAWSRSFLPA